MATPTEAKNNKRLIFLQLFNSVSNRPSPVARAKFVTIGTGIDAVSCHLVQGRRSEQEGITYRNKDDQTKTKYTNRLVDLPELYNLLNQTARPLCVRKTNTAG